MRFRTSSTARSAADIAGAGGLRDQAAQGFAAVMFGRLDLFREASVIVPVPLAYAPVRKGPFVAMPPPPPPSPLPVYALAAERKPEEFDKLIAGVFRQGDTGSLQLESDPFLA